MSEHREEEQIAKGSGKWSCAGVPHKGWTYSDIVDLGAPDQVCEMCETKSIRYVHYMEHPDYPDRLGVGCICASHMEQDYAAAKNREKQLKNVAQRRKKWPRRKWKESAKGNSYINTDGFNIVLYKRIAMWQCGFTNRETQEKFYPQKEYATLEQAKLAAFDHLISLKGTQ